MKGFLKGLRYISQIFDGEGKEQEIQIGFPTDVKHVAHIGHDGPSFDTPSWMKEFQYPSRDREDPEITWGSKDSRRSNTSGGDHNELPKSFSRNSVNNNNTSNSLRKKDPSSKSRQSRKHSSKELSEEIVKSGPTLCETSLVTNSPSRNLTSIPKKSETKKSKELVNGSESSRTKKSKELVNGCGSSWTKKSKELVDGSRSSRTRKSKELVDGSGSSRSRSKARNSNGSHSSQYSHPGPNSDAILRTSDSQLSPIPSVDGEEKESTKISCVITKFH